MESNDIKRARQLPTILFFMEECRNLDGFIKQEEIDSQCSFEKDIKMNMLPDNSPLYCQRYKSPPTICTTPGKTIPAGYTPSGKYKTARYRPAKSDKRAGK